MLIETGLTTKLQLENYSNSILTLKQEELYRCSLTGTFEYLDRYVLIPINMEEHMPELEDDDYGSYFPIPTAEEYEEYYKYVDDWLPEEDESYLGETETYDPLDFS